MRNRRGTFTGAGFVAVLAWVGCGGNVSVNGTGSTAGGSGGTSAGLGGTVAVAGGASGSSGAAGTGVGGADGTGGAGIGGAEPSSGGSESSMGGMAVGGLGGAAAGGSAGETSGTGGEPQVECDEASLRCSPESGFREECQSGTWVEQDFVCATSVRVDHINGNTCALKADGEFDCWTFIGSPFFRGDKPEPPGPLRSVYPVRDPVVFWLLEDGTFIDDGADEFANIVDFDSYGGRTCMVAADGTATCLSGAMAPSSATQVVMSSAARCVLLEDAQVYCEGSDDQSLTLDARYQAIALSSQNFCGIDLDGVLACGSFDLSPFELQPDTMAPLEGSFTKLAMSDTTVCGITEANAVMCASPSGDNPYEQPGTFTDIEGGDHVFCAIHVDGSVSCWLSEELITLPEGW